VNERDRREDHQRRLVPKKKVEKDPISQPKSPIKLVKKMVQEDILY